MADWNLPTLNSNYTDVLNDLKNRDENNAKMLDGTSDTNLPVGVKRWNRTNVRFEKWDGSAWAELATLYNINVSQLGGHSASYFAQLQGDATKTFSVAIAISDDEAVSKGQLDSSLSSAVPTGVITMWSGLISAIPTGWYLCDGANGTPDLRDRFIYGAGVDGDVNVTGGSADLITVAHTHTGASHTHTANHSHTASSNSTGSHSHTLPTVNNTNSATGVPTDGNLNSGQYVSTSSTGAHSHTITVNSASVTTSASGTGNTGSTGSSGTNANLPPYMKLAYIMKG